MGSKDLKKEIMELISKVTETDIRRIDVKVSFMKGLNVDSLMALEIIAALEKKYKIEIKEEDFPKLAMINDTVSLVEKRLRETRKMKETKDSNG